MYNGRAHSPFPCLADTHVYPHDPLLSIWHSGISNLESRSCPRTPSRELIAYQSSQTPVPPVGPKCNCHDCHACTGLVTSKSVACVRAVRHWETVGVAEQEDVRRPCAVLGIQSHQPTPALEFPGERMRQNWKHLVTWWLSQSTAASHVPSRLWWTSHTVSIRHDCLGLHLGRGCE